MPLIILCRLQAINSKNLPKRITSDTNAVLNQNCLMTYLTIADVSVTKTYPYLGLTTYPKQTSTNKIDMDVYAYHAKKNY